MKRLVGVLGFSLLCALIGYGVCAFIAWSWDPGTWTERLLAVCVMGVCGAAGGLAASEAMPKRTNP